MQLGTLPPAITLDAPNVLARLGQNLEENVLIAQQARLPMLPTQDVRGVQGVQCQCQEASVMHVTLASSPIVMALPACSVLPMRSQMLTRLVA